MGTIAAADVRARLAGVIAAMKAAGAWDVERPSVAQLEDAGPFGMASIAFEQWLRYVFAANVEALLAAGGPWPDRSMIAVHASREWDGHSNPDGMLAALRAFDALFAPGEPAPPQAPPPASATQAYEASRAAFERGDRDAALVAIRAALAADPTVPNGHNHAGWVLVRSPRTAADLDDAIAHFRAARALDPDDCVPLANLCDALVAAGRDLDATAEAESAMERCPAGAHHWLGCRDLGRGELNERAIMHLRAAAGHRSRWGLAHLNLGKALENADRHDEWYEQFVMALSCEDDFDRAYCHERIAAYQARRGWFRNALGHLRAALREDDRCAGERRPLHVEGLAWVEQQLRAAGIEPVPPGRENGVAWTRACELELPPGLLATNELGEPLADDVVEVERLVRAERWADAAAQLAMLRGADFNKLFDAVGYAESGADRALAAGARAEALAMMKVVVEAYRYHASGASSGGEGTARMLDVNRTSAKLAAWTAREPGRS